MAGKIATSKNVSSVLRRFADYLDTLTVKERAPFARDVNIMLNSITDADGFGTEGQCDPRGDHRNNERG